MPEHQTGVKQQRAPFMQHPRCLRVLSSLLLRHVNPVCFRAATSIPTTTRHIIRGITMSDGEPQSKKHKPDPDSLDIHGRLVNSRRNVMFVLLYDFVLTNKWLGFIAHFISIESTISSTSLCKPFLYGSLYPIIRKSES